VNACIFSVSKKCKNIGEPFKDFSWRNYLRWRMQVRENYSLKSLNTFGLNINCRWFAEITHPDELTSLISDRKFSGVRKMILGGGSNVLFSGDFDGLIIHNNIGSIEIIEEDGGMVMLKSGAGVVWNDFVQFAIAHNFPGLENLSLIPGSVGAAPIQNIGAYGVEIKNTFHQLTAINLESGKKETFTLEQCRFGYRDSIFKNEAKNKYAITDVTFRLNKSEPVNTSYGAINEQLAKMNISSPTIRDVSEAVIAIRQSKLPDPKKIGNAGSFFKNPEIPLQQFEDLKSQYPELSGYPSANNMIKIAAGWLIEKAGWKGRRMGNVGMHEKQALVLVNYGGATGAELIEHAHKVQSDVLDKFGVKIEMEVNLV
jgi:UDP-N-acetylmuramate dehydrogenase